MKLNSAPLEVTVTPEEMLTVETGKVVVSGTGQDLYQVYDVAGEDIRSNEYTNTEVELFPRTYTLYLHSEPLTVPIVADSLNTINTGRLIVSGNGDTLYQVYDSSGLDLRANEWTNTEIELFPTDYVVINNNGSPSPQPQPVTIRADEVTRL